MPTGMHCGAETALIRPAWEPVQCLDEVGVPDFGGLSVFLWLDKMRVNTLQVRPDWIFRRSSGDTEFALLHWLFALT
jgi:hypothetical protein